MTMLIKGGLIHTMTGQGSLLGDILIRGDQIEAVAPCIDPPEDASPCVLDAHGMTILPGLIDPHIQDGPETGECILSSPHAAGVTSGLLWPEEEGCCRVISAMDASPTSLHTIHPQEYTDAQLHNRFLTLAEDGFRPVCTIGSAQECRRILQTVHSTRVKAVLTNLCGCEDMLEAIALSGCPVILGVSQTRSCSPWANAVRLSARDAAVALSCGYPYAKLRHLPLCAALCVREGMDRERAMHTVTTAPAALCGLPDAGCIAAGFRADLAIYDGDPLLLATSHVMTISGGKIRH